MIKQKTIENDLEFLRQISRPVDFEHDDVKGIAQELKEYCANESLSMALAAVQLGFPLRILYLKKLDESRLDDDNYDENRILINPEIISAEGEALYWEACASCGDLTGLVSRPYKIVVKFFDEDGIEHIEVFEGLPATVVCHELDHFDGVLHIDIAMEVHEYTAEERIELRKRESYKIIKKTGEYSLNRKEIMLNKTSYSLKK